MISFHLKFLLYVTTFLDLLLFYKCQQTCDQYAEAAGNTQVPNPIQCTATSVYYFTPLEESFEDARKTCQDLPPFNGVQFDLVVIESQEELDVIVTLPLRLSVFYRLGLMANSISNPTWINGAPYTLGVEPPEDGLCLEFSQTTEIPAQLVFSTCEIPRFTICEPSLPYIPPSEACNEIKSQYFIPEENADVQISWEDAQSACMEENAKLATIQSLKENLCLFEKFASLNTFWLGLINNLSKKKFQWIDNDNSAYRSWCDGRQPPLGSEGCVVVRFPSEQTTGCFDLVDCDESHNFVCEIQTGCNEYCLQTLTQSISKSLQKSKNDCASCRIE
uniref:C-type lectin domain-containing protein n=1 Tax=Clytia hemisphaerica TaxID=252671 RepID=A0A7M5VGV9_9CNID